MVAGERGGVAASGGAHQGADAGEGDGLPTSGYDALGKDTGLPGEPNIDKTDVDESDQIGLSSFYYFTPAGQVRLGDDEEHRGCDRGTQHGQRQGQGQGGEQVHQQARPRPGRRPRCSSASICSPRPTTRTASAAFSPAPNPPGRPPGKNLAAAPGQAVVWYAGDEVVGGGWIDEALAAFWRSFEPTEKEVQVLAEQLLAASPKSSPKTNTSSSKTCNRPAMLSA